jgi:hypothetical protein
MTKACEPAHEVCRITRNQPRQPCPCCPHQARFQRQSAQNPLVYTAHRSVMFGFQAPCDDTLAQLTVRRSFRQKFAVTTPVPMTRGVAMTRATTLACNFRFCQEWLGAKLPCLPCVCTRGWLNRLLRYHLSQRQRQRFVNYDCLFCPRLLRQGCGRGSERWAPLQSCFQHFPARLSRNLKT